jgi:hypothetical protein
MAPNKALPERLVKKDLFRDANIDEIGRMINHLVATKQIKKVPMKHPVSGVAEVFLQKL